MGGSIEPSRFGQDIDPGPNFQVGLHVQSECRELRASNAWTDSRGVSMRHSALLDLHDDAFLVSRLLDTIEQEIAPRTRREVARGNKIFGAAILRKSDLSLVVAETNNEVENPLWHGEMHAIKRLYERPRQSIPEPRDCIFLATHEPCSLCLSAITWSGYDNFFYLFSHQDSRDSFAIPHDIRIFEEVFGPPARPSGAPLYNRRNAFWEAVPIRDVIGGLKDEDARRLSERVKSITAVYEKLSAAYQAGKGQQSIPMP